MLSLAARLDLDDLTHTTGRGLHLATMGGVWQALAHGFMGVRPRGDTLVIDPVLPSTWDSVSLTVRFRGAPLRIQATGDAVDVTCDGHDAALPSAARRRSRSTPRTRAKIIDLVPADDDVPSVDPALTTVGSRAAASRPDRAK